MRQSPEETEIMDLMTAQLYEQFEGSGKANIVQFLKTFLNENGDKYINLRDSSGNCFIHNLCMAATDEDTTILTDVVNFLLKSAQDDATQLEKATCQNFLSKLALSPEAKSKALSDLGISETSPEALSQIFKVNPGNSFGQTPLHILAGSKKTSLLTTFLDVVYQHVKEDGDQSLIAHSLIGFNPNQPETTNKTFMMILLEKKLLQTFEEIASKYSKVLELKALDMFLNSPLMTYKALKREQINELKKQRKFPELVQDLKTANVTAFGDLRNVLFDREIGTNILTDFVTGQDQNSEDLIIFMKEISAGFATILPDIIIPLLNVPDKQGGSISLKVLQKLCYDDIQKIIEMIGGPSKLSYTANTKTLVSLTHNILSNKQLTSPQKLELLDQFKSSDQVLSAPDFQGNYPLNLLIEVLSRKHTFDEADFNLFKYVASNTDLKQFQDPQLIKEAEEQNAEEQKKKYQLRKDLAQRNERLKDKKVKAIKSATFNKYQIRSDIRKNQVMLQEYNKDVIKATQPINPLEVAIKRNCNIFAEILIKDHRISPMMLSSDFKDTLLEISANSTLEMFETVVSHLGDEISVTFKPVQTILKIHAEIQARVINDVGSDDTIKAKLNQTISKLIKALLKEEKFKDTIEQELNQDDGCFMVESVEQLQTLNKAIKAGQSPTHAVQLAQQSVKQGNYELLKRIIDTLEFTDQDSRDYFNYRLFKERACRNDYDGMRRLCTEYPDIQTTIKNLDSKKKRNLSKSMFTTFRDILDPTSFRYIKDELKVILVPILTEIKPQLLKKIERDQRYLRLPAPQQHELISQIQAQAFKQVSELMSNSEINDREVTVAVNEAVDAYLNGRNKQSYLTQLVEANALFKLMDIRRESQQSTIGEFIQSTLKQGNLKLGISLLQQLKDYLQANCSVYPADFCAEVTQYERNYPYRKFDMSNFQRKMNFKGDSYPVYLGQIDSGDIDDDQEEYLSMIWEEMLLSRVPIHTTAKPGLPNISMELKRNPDIFVPNGNAILFKMFAGLMPIHLHLTPENASLVKQLFNQVFELGGYPLVELTNLKDFITVHPKGISETEQIQFQCWTKLTSKFNQCTKNGKFQTILHQMAFDTEVDPTLLKSLCHDESLQRENFNSRDSTGKSPITIAIECGNFSFLSIVQQCRNIFIKDDQQLTSVIQNCFNTAKVDWKFKLLKFLSDCVHGLTTHQKEILLQNNKRTINDFIDTIYLMQEDNAVENLEYNRIGQGIMKSLETPAHNFNTHNKQINSTYKFARGQLQSLLQKSDNDKSIIFGWMISPSFLLGELVTQLASEATIDQIKDLMKSGFNICNSIASSFSGKYSSKSLTPHFPFDSAAYHLSYALKFAIQNQPQNREMIDYIFGQMDLQMWRPFLFEVMILIGKTYGTQDPMFISLFQKEKAYLMGRILTVECRITSFAGSHLPPAALLYYTESAYKRMLVTLTELLIQHGEQLMFTQFINEQARFYLCKELIIKGLEACCRYFKPKIAILLACLCIQEELEHQFVDYSNLLPSLQAKVTMKIVQQTAMIVKSLDKKWSPLNLVKKLSREMLDEFVGYLVDSELLHHLFNFEDKDKMYEQQKLLLEIYHKSSPEVIPAFIEGLWQLCTIEKSQFRLVKTLLILPSKAEYAPIQNNFSKHHANKRRQEVRSYLFSKIDKFASEPSYCNILLNEQRTKELAELLSLTDADIIELRGKVSSVRQEVSQVENEEFVYGEMQTLIGVFRVKNGQLPQGRSNRNDTDQIKEMQKYSLKDVPKMSREDLKTKSENLILLWEFLGREEKRRRGETFSRQNNSNTINDQELRKLMMRSVPTSINIESLFSGFDTTILNNDIEDILAREKFKIVTNSIDISKFSQLKQLKKMLNSVKMTSNSWDHTSGCHNSIVLDFFIDTYQVYLQASLEAIKVEKPPVQENDEDEIDYSDTEAQRLITMQYTVSDMISNGVKSNGNPFIQKIVLQALPKFLKVNSMVEFFKLSLSKEQYKEFFGDMFIGKLLLCPLVYKEVRESLIMKMIKTRRTQFGFILNDEGESVLDNNRRLYYYLLTAIPLFNSQLNDDVDNKLKSEVLSDQEYMVGLPNRVRECIFALLASNGSDKHLLQMRQYMRDINSLEELQQMKSLFNLDNAFPLKLKNVTSSTIRPMSYLVYCKRFSIIRDYYETYSEVSLPLVLGLLQAINPQKEEEKKLFLWILEKSDVNPEDNQDLLQTFLLKANGAALIKEISSHFTGGVLLSNQIEVMTKAEEDKENRSGVSLIHNLIHNLNYQGVYAIHELATPDQWEFFKQYKAPWAESEEEMPAESEADSEIEKQVASGVFDLIRPFFKALTQSQFDLCRLLMISPDDIRSNMTYTELTLFSNFMGDAPIMSFAKSLRVNNQDTLIRDFEEIVYSYTHQMDHMESGDHFQQKELPTFDLAKKIILLPEILYFIHLAPRRGIDLFQAAKKKVNKDNGFNHEVDAFYTQCGLTPLHNKSLTNQSESYIFYILETAFDLKAIGKDQTHSGNEDLLFKPYSFFKNAGVLKERLKVSNGNVFKSERLDAIMGSEELRVIIDEQRTFCLTIFFQDIDMIVAIGIAKKKFAYTFYLLQLQLHFRIWENFSVKSLRECQWNIHFDTLSHDLIIIDLLKRVLPEETLFKAYVGTNVQDITSYIFYGESADGAQRPYCPSNQPRFLALLLSMFNSHGNLMKLDRFPYEPQEEEKKQHVKVPEPENLENFSDIMKAYLRSSHQYKIVKGQDVEIETLATTSAILYQSLAIYNDTFSSGQLKELSTKLGTTLSYYDQQLMTNATRVSDESIFKALVELADFDNTSYKNYFQFKFQFNDIRQLAMQVQSDVKVYRFSYNLSYLLQSALIDFTHTISQKYRQFSKKQFIFSGQSDIINLKFKTVGIQQSLEMDCDIVVASFELEEKSLTNDELLQVEAERIAKALDEFIREKRPRSEEPVVTEEPLNTEGGDIEVPKPKKGAKKKKKGFVVKEEWQF